MNSITAFLIGTGLTAVTSIGVIIYIGPHLKSILSELCGTRERAGFWAALCNMSIIIIPVLISMVHYPDASPNNVTALFFEITSQYWWGLVGLIFTVLVIGAYVMGYIPKEKKAPEPKQVTSKSTGYGMSSSGITTKPVTAQGGEHPPGT